MFNELIDRNGYVKINIEMINNVRLTMMQWGRRHSMAYVREDKLNMTEEVSLLWIKEEKC
jgi:hypothetical protein